MCLIWYIASVFKYSNGDGCEQNFIRKFTVWNKILCNEGKKMRLESIALFQELTGYISDYLLTAVLQNVILLHCCLLFIFSLYCRQFTWGHLIAVKMACYGICNTRCRKFNDWGPTHGNVPGLYVDPRETSDDFGLVSVTLRWPLKILQHRLWHSYTRQIMIGSQILWHEIIYHVSHMMVEQEVEHELFCLFPIQ